MGIPEVQRPIDEAKEGVIDRRNFFKGAMGGAVAFASSTGVPTHPQASSAPNILPNEDPPPESDVLTLERSGSDFMTDVLKSLNFEYVCANPGSSFRGLHESIINYGGNKSPEFITCCHEESSVAMAHGYAKIEGKPLCVFAHGTVGLQHASMAIYNAYCDRVPIYIILGNTLEATKRRPGAEWVHSVQDACAAVRDYIKWDDLPLSLPHFAESAIRAYKIAMTPPRLPVVLVADSELQENPISKDVNFHIPQLTIPSPPQGDSGAVKEASRLLANAENPVIVVDRSASNQEGVDRLVELAELLQAPIIDQAGRMNFPSRHPLNQSARRHQVISNADVILALDVSDLWGVVNSLRDQMHRSSRQGVKPGTKLISITSGDLYVKSNYQDAQRFQEVDIPIAADSEATLPSLIEEIRRQLSSERKSALLARWAKLKAARLDSLEEAKLDASYGWDASPITVARLCAEVWAQIKNEDWSFVSQIGPIGAWPMGGWPLRLWAFEKHYHYIGGSGGAGVGYNAPAAVGAALANRKHGRITVNIQSDGDLLYAPAILWTAAHHRIPILNVMHNNRAYHQELMHVQRMANRHSRGIDRTQIGTSITDPNINFAKIAEGMGVYAEGPITDPNDLGAALGRALAVVKGGEPALVDVITQPR
jgi:acetolactate synthase-1/2/3 large subunit